MPDINMTHLDQYLTDYSISYQNLEFVGKQIFKPKFEDKQSNKYPIFGFERFKIHRTGRAPGAASPEMEPWRLSNDAYFCAGQGQKMLIADEVRGNDDGLDIEIETTEDLSDIIWLWHEILVYNALFNPPAWTLPVPGTTLSGTAQWSDFTNSNPVAAVLAQKATIMLATGKVPNTLLVAWPVHIQLMQHPIIVDRFKFTQIPSDEEVREVLRTIFEVDNYLVAKALYDTAKQGQPANLNFVWGKNAALLYVPPAAGKRIMTIGNTFMWTYGVPNNEGLLVKRYRDEHRTGDWIEYQAWYDVKVVVPGCGYTFTAASAV